MPHPLPQDPAVLASSAPNGLHDEECWQAVATRNAALDGYFYYAVATTGIYCRPSCPAKKPKRGNVRFYATPALAESAGFRPCKRCRPSPDQERPGWPEKIQQACRLMERAGRPVPLAELARHTGSSPHHFHRQFKSLLGVTPKAYAGMLRDDRLRMGLRRGASVTEALYEAGFGSSCSFYSDSAKRFGMSPSVFRDGAPSEEISYVTGHSSLGAVLVAATSKGVCAILLGDDPGDLVNSAAELFPKAALQEGDERLAALAADVIALVDKPDQKTALPLDIQGTAFQRRVWDALMKIPPGTTAAYADIAAAIGAPKSVRAVAGACAANKLAVAIPCHRVVRQDGNLSGYRWGPARKRALLDKEKGLEKGLEKS